MTTFTFTSAAKVALTVGLCCSLLIACGGDEPSNASPTDTGGSTSEPPDGGQGGLGGSGGDGSGGVDACKPLIQPDLNNMATFEFVDFGVEGDSVPMHLAVDGCDPFEEGPTLTRGGMTAYGFAPGKRTVSVTFHKTEVFADEVETVPGDIIFRTTIGSDPVQVYRAKDSFVEPAADKWKLFIWNHKDVEVTLFSEVDPSAKDAEYKELAKLPAHEFYSVEVPISAEHGARMKIVGSDGETVHEGKVHYGSSCFAGDYGGKLGFFILLHDVGFEVINYPQYAKGICGG